MTGSGQGRRVPQRRPTTCGDSRNSAPTHEPRRNSQRPTAFGIRSASTAGRSPTPRAVGSPSNPSGATGGGDGRRSGRGRIGTRARAGVRRRGPLGMRGLARRHRPRDRCVRGQRRFAPRCSSWSPTSPARPRPAGPCARRRGGRLAPRRHGLGGGAQRRALPVARADRRRGGRLDRADRRCLLTDRDGAQGPRSGCGRAVRHRDRATCVSSTRRPDARPVRRGRGLLDGVPARGAHRRRRASTRSSGGTAPPTSTGRSASRTRASAAAWCRCP